jgi:hypothetical protein
MSTSSRPNAANDPTTAPRGRRSAPRALAARPPQQTPGLCGRSRAPCPRTPARPSCQPGRNSAPTTGREPSRGVSRAGMRRATRTAIRNASARCPASPGRLGCGAVAGSASTRTPSRSPVRRRASPRTGRRSPTRAAKMPKPIVVESGRLLDAADEQPLAKAADALALVAAVDSPPPV